MEIEHRFDALTQRLQTHAALWRPSPFKEPKPDWLDDRPALANFVGSLTQGDVQRFQSDPVAHVDALLPLIEGLSEVVALQSLGRLPGGEVPALDPRRVAGIPGRKMAQVAAFVACATPLSGAFVEWCSGKGHLSRVLSEVSGVSGVCLERNPSLCASGSALATKHHQPLHFEVQDVLSEGVERHLSPKDCAVALHACGKLHRRLLEVAVAQGVRRVVLAPCCYAYLEGPRYRPLSARGLQSGLALGSDAVRMCLQQTVVGTGRRRRRRRERAIERLAFDALQRGLRGVDAYLEVPGFDPREGSAATAERLGLGPVSRTALAAAKAAGVERYERAAALDLVRHAFRRALEVWLVLDRALFLKEHDRRVQVGAFCSPLITPRNLLIAAD